MALQVTAPHVFAIRTSSSPTYAMAHWGATDLKAALRSWNQIRQTPILWMHNPVPMHLGSCAHNHNSILFSIPFEPCDKSKLSIPFTHCVTKCLYLNGTLPILCLYLSIVVFNVRLVTIFNFHCHLLSVSKACTGSELIQLGSYHFVASGFAEPWRIWSIIAHLVVCLCSDYRRWAV